MLFLIEEQGIQVLKISTIGRQRERERERERNKTPILNYFVLKTFQCRIPERRKRSFADTREHGKIGKKRFKRPGYIGTVDASTLRLLMVVNHQGYSTTEQECF